MKMKTGNIIGKYVMFAQPDNAKYPEISSLTRKMQTHHHTLICREKKDLM